MVLSRSGFTSDRALTSIDTRERERWMSNVTRLAVVNYTPILWTQHKVVNTVLDNSQFNYNNVKCSGGRRAMGYKITWKKFVVFRSNVSGLSFKMFKFLEKKIIWLEKRPSSKRMDTTAILTKKKHYFKNTTVMYRETHRVNNIFCIQRYLTSCMSIISCTSK